MKKIKYFLFLFLLLPFQVYADESFSSIATNGQIGQWQIPLNAQCFNSSFNSVNTYFINNTISVGGIDGKDYYQCNFGSNGLISITFNQLTEASKLYSLVLFVGNSNSIKPNNPTQIGLGSDTYSSRNDIVYSINRGVMWASTVSNVLELQQPSESSLSYLDYYAVYVVFESHSNSNSISINLSYSSSVSNTWIFGYELNYIGNSSNLSSSDIQNLLANSGLATSSSVEQVQQSVNQVQEQIKDTNDTLTDDDTTDSTNKANEFFSGFTTDTFGLTSIITAPLTLIGSITSSTCSPLSLDIPFLSKNNKLSLPCMSSIYQENFGSFLTIYQTITFGIVAYWVCVRIFALVKEFKNPDEDKVEVLDL